jgi:ABC-2 type transport system ATP-binding protein
MTTDPPVLRCTHLVRRFGERTAVDDVSFEIRSGETYGLLGPNGAGKTTTISMIAGILDPDDGHVEVLGRPVTERGGDAKRSIGFVPQDIALFEDLTAVENLRFFGRLQHLSGRHLDERIATVLDVVGLADRGRDRIESYSGGMKRRANIAVGLLHEPRLLILDEPTVGVDPQSRNQILESIETLGGAGLSVLYTTHYMEEAQRLCDRVAIIDEGRIVAEGTQAELVALIGAHERIVVEVDHGPGVAGLAERCRALPGVLSVDASDRAIEVSTDSARTTLAHVVEVADALGVTVAGLDVRRPDLEAVFLHVTGKALRD